MNLKASFVTFLNQKFPRLSLEVLESTVSDNLLSPFQVNLAPKQFAAIQTEIDAYWKLRAWGETHLAEEYAQHGLRIPKNYSACMSYDFHVSVDGNLELIEINTNAAFLAMGLQMYSFLKIKNPVSSFNDQALIEMFKNEIALCGRADLSVAIFDEAPEQQRLYIEFLVYNEIFKQNNMNADIVSLENVTLLKKHSLVYNRYTDFMLREPKSAELKTMFNAGEVELSPNPYEYYLLADKKRFLDWNLQKNVPIPASLLPTYDLGIANHDQIWAARKGLFFKPKNSFGSKQAYRGASISKRTFDEIFNDGFIAQKLSHPGEIEVLHAGQKQIMKYDLRCYAYKNELQLIMARIYQGQTTNLRTPGGGFAVVTIG